MTRATATTSLPPRIETRRGTSQIRAACITPQDYPASGDYKTLPETLTKKAQRPSKPRDLADRERVDLLDENDSSLLHLAIPLNPDPDVIDALVACLSP